MSSIADHANPSSYLLLAVAVANVVMALMIWSDPGAPEMVPAPSPAAAEPVVRAAPAPAVLPAPLEKVSLRRPAPVCQAWGPFTEMADAEKLAGRLALDTRDFEVFHSDVAAEPDYLVTVRAPGSREAAERILRELESQNLDSYILERGSQSNLLAVGVFSVPGGAEKRREQLAALGYEADIAPLQRSHRVYHLLARVAADRELEVSPAGGCGDIAPMQRFL